jgi:hypothetical protein
MAKQCKQCKKPPPVFARWRGWHREPGDAWYCPVHWREWKDPDAFHNTGTSGREMEVSGLLRMLFLKDYAAGRPALANFRRVRFYGRGDHIRVFVDLVDGNVSPAGVVKRSMTPAQQAETIRQGILTFAEITKRIRGG